MALHFYSMWLICNGAPVDTDPVGQSVDLDDPAVLGDDGILARLLRNGIDYVGGRSDDPDYELHLRVGGPNPDLPVAFVYPRDAR